MKILIINAGSSSLKYQLIDMADTKCLAKGLCERIGIEGSCLKHETAGKEAVIIKQEMPSHADAIKMVIDTLINKEYGVISSMDEIAAVGHRVVHGGEYFKTSVIIDDEVEKAIEACIELAPLHNPPNLIGIRACKEVIPNCPQVAVFDTAFHQTMPPEAYTYAIPFKFYDKYKIRRYGFHGTSHKYVSQKAAEFLGKPLNTLKIITLHLGNGSSITAVKHGESVDTSMGFTPLAGIPMGTRSGDIDPAILTFLMQKEHLTAEEVIDGLNKQSGVFGVSGVSSDFRDIASARDCGNVRATLAENMFIHSVKKYIGKYAAVMGGVDALVFTAGIGENNSEIRYNATKNLEFMGIKVDSDKNQVRGVEADVSTDDATVRTLVIPTNEELMIAKETLELIQ